MVAPYTLLRKIYYAPRLFRVPGPHAGSMADGVVLGDLARRIRPIDAVRPEILAGQALPAEVRPRACRARMQHRAQAHRPGRERPSRAIRCERTHTDDVRHAELADDAIERGVTGREECRLLALRELVRRPVLSRGFEKCKRTVVPHEEALEEAPGRAETVADETPEAAAAHLAARAREAEHGPGGVLAFGLRHDPLDPEKA